MAVRSGGLLLSILLHGLLAAALSGCGEAGGQAVKNRNTPPAGETAREGGAADRVLVRLGAFTRGSISSVLSVSADLEAVEEADVYPERAGVIRSVEVEEGDRVERGQPVIVLVDDEQKLALETKKLLLEQAKTALEQAQVALREAEALKAQKEILEEKAQREYERIEKLAEAGEGIVSPEEAETKRYERDQAVIDRRTAELGVETKRLALEQARQSLKQAELDLRQAEIEYARTRIASPIDGYVTRLDLKPGETVTTATLAFTVVNVDRLRARVHVPQRELRRLKVGQKVLLRTEIWPDDVFEGRVDVINPVIDKDTGTVRLLVGVTDTEGRLRPGMFVTADIVLDTHENAWLAPKRAVVYENEEPVIYLAEGGKALRCVLTPGYTSKDAIEVLRLTAADGSQVDPAGAKLILVGQANLKDGTPIEVE